MSLGPREPLNRTLSIEASSQDTQLVLCNVLVIHRAHREGVSVLFSILFIPALVVVVDKIRDHIFQGERLKLAREELDV